MIACVAIVGQKNNPLHVQSLYTDQADPLKFDYLVYTSLDAIDAILFEQDDRRRQLKASLPPTEHSKLAPDPYFLGLVNVTPEYHVYGYVTSTYTKIIVVASAGAMSPHTPVADDISMLCTELHHAYNRAVSNPFYTPGAVLESSGFSGAVERIVGQLASAGPQATGGLAASAVL